MALHTYDESLRRLLGHEGNYTNHPSDPGGPTNWGITIHDYRKYIKSGATAADVRAMSIDEAKGIYRLKYWDAMRCSELPAGVDYCVFDYGVNSGTGRAPKVLQRVLGVPVDGVVGDLTMRALAERDASAVIVAICDERLRFLQNLKTWPVFGRGWGRRVAEVRAAALRMAATAPPAAATDAPPDTAKKTDDGFTGAEPIDAVTVAPMGKGEVPAPKILKEAVRTGTPTGVGGVLIAMRDWVYAHPTETGLLLIIVSGGGWWAWRAINAWRQRKQEAPMPDTPIVPVKA